MLLANLGSLEDFTFSVWAKIDPANTGYLFTNNPTAGATLFLKPEPSANRFVLSDRPNAGFGLEIQSYAFDGDWHHLALVRDYAGAVLKLYVDGVLIGTHTARGLTDLSGLKTGDQFTGTLDEFQIWSIARTASEIQSSLNKRLNGTEDGLICYWRFDEGAGNNVGDATGNGFDGAITSAAWVNSRRAGRHPAALPHDRGEQRSQPRRPARLAQDHPRGRRPVSRRPQDSLPGQCLRRAPHAAPQQRLR